MVFIRRLNEVSQIISMNSKQSKFSHDYIVKNLNNLKALVASNRADVVSIKTHFCNQCIADNNLLD